MDWTDKAVFALFVAIIATVALVLVDAVTLRDVGSECATVMHTGYKPAEVRTGASSSEEWTVVVKTADGVPVGSKTDRLLWAELKPGEQVRLVQRRGWVGLFRATVVRR